MLYVFRLITIPLGGAPFNVGTFPHRMRINLMRAHLGDTVAQQSNYDSLLLFKLLFTECLLLYHHFSEYR